MGFDGVQRLGAGLCYAMLCYAMLIWPGMIRYDPGWAGACWGLLGSRLGISSRYLLWGGRRPSTSLDRRIRSSTQGTYYGGVEVARTPKNTPRRTSTPHSKYLHPRCSYGPFAIADLTPHWRRNGYLGTSPRPSGQNYPYGVSHLKKNTKVHRKKRNGRFSSCGSELTNF